MLRNQNVLKNVLKEELPDFVVKEIDWKDGFENIFRHLDEEDMTPRMLERIVKLNSGVIYEIPLRLCDGEDWLEKTLTKCFNNKSFQHPIQVWLYAYLVFKNTGSKSCLKRAYHYVHKKKGNVPFVIDEYDANLLKDSAGDFYVSAESRDFQNKLFFEFWEDFEELFYKELYKI